MIPSCIVRSGGGQAAADDQLARRAQDPEWAPGHAELAVVDECGCLDLELAVDLAHRCSTLSGTCRPAACSSPRALRVPSCRVTVPATKRTLEWLVTSKNSPERRCASRLPCLVSSLSASIVSSSAGRSSRLRAPS